MKSPPQLNMGLSVISSNPEAAEMVAIVALAIILHPKP
jgi:hypothetical protein